MSTDLTARRREEKPTAAKRGTYRPGGPTTEIRSHARQIRSYAIQRSAHKQDGDPLINKTGSAHKQDRDTLTRKTKVCSRTRRRSTHIKDGDMFTNKTRIGSQTRRDRLTCARDSLTNAGRRLDFIDPERGRMSSPRSYFNGGVNLRSSQVRP